MALDGETSQDDPQGSNFMTVNYNIWHQAQ